MTSRRVLVLLLAAAPLTQARAAAQVPPAEDEAGGASEEIDVVGRRPGGLGTAATASSGTVTGRVLEEHPLLRTGEVLERVPGLVITQHAGAGKANQYFLRGFNLDHGTDFATTLDGVPLNLRTHAHGQGYTDLNFLIPELIDRVDYFKGPYFASKGDFGSAGAAELRYATELEDQRLALTGGGGGYARTLAIGSPPLDGGRLLYGFELFHEDGPWVRPDDYRRMNAVLRYTRRSGELEWSATVMSSSGVWNGTDQVPLRAVDDGRISRFGGVDPTTGGRTERHALSAQLAGPLGPGTFQASAYAVRYRLDLFSNFTYALVHADTGDQFEQSDDRWLAGASGVWSVEDASGGRRVAVGWEVRDDRVDPLAVYHTEARRRLDTIRRDAVREQSGGVWIEAGAAPAPWLRTTAGVRYDGYRFVVRSDRAPNSGVEDAGRASPKVSAVLGPWRAAELFASWGAGFHSNDARGVTTREDPQTGVAVARVTPLVGTRGRELGVRVEPLAGLRSSVTLWRLDLASELLFVGDAGTTEPSRSSRRQGVEVSTRWRAARWVDLDLDLAWSSARFTDPDPAGDHIPGSIETALAAGASLHHLGSFTAGVFFRYFGPRPLVEDGSIRSSGSATLNGRLGYRFGLHAEGAIEIFNALDARVDDIAYAYVSRLPGEPAPTASTRSQVHVHPAERRTVRAMVAFHY